MQGAFSSSGSLIPPCTHDVFLSFRGKDTRSGFTYHLYKALEREKIKTFFDDRKLKKGENISAALLQAIEVSKISVVICSENYGSSSWCLDELVKIFECQESKQQIVIPVFYELDPSDVRHQKGRFGEAFAGLKYNQDKIPKWRAALTQVANLSGWTYVNGYESDFIDKIVKEILDLPGLDGQKKKEDVVAQTNGSIAVGASLSTVGNSSSWTSPFGDFSFGFRQLENSDLFLLSIWFAKIPDRTIVWYANGDMPAPSGSVVTLTASGLVLRSPQGELLWKSNQTIAGVVARGVMNDTGNFVLEDEKSAKLWETFKNPTDTMLPGQKLERGGELSSRNSETDYSKGSFQLDFQDDGNLVFTAEKPYYSTATTSGTVPGSEGKQLVFNDSGDFYILRVNGGRYKFTAKQRAGKDYYLRSTLSFDGVLAQYFLPKTFSGNVTWVPLWSIGQRH